jgi:diketogulonate reductase-like aldo/keto reductase
MKVETLPQSVTVPKIGFGMWKIGGGSTADASQDARSLTALRAALSCGYTHFDTAEMYARGHSEELLAQALKDTGTPRDRVFITTKVTPSNLRYADLRHACERSLRRLQTDYIDLYLIHWPGSVPLADSFRALNELHAEGKIRHIGVSNFDLKLLKEAQSLSRSPILTNQVPYSLTDRSCVRNGVLAHCQANDILLTAYSPVDEGRLRVTSALESVAHKHAATPYQIALAWLVRQPRVITIPMSMNPAHIAENFQAADIELEADALRLLD